VPSCGSGGFFRDFLAGGADDFWAFRDFRADLDGMFVPLRMQYPTRHRCQPAGAGPFRAVACENEGAEFSLFFRELARS